MKSDQYWRRRSEEVAARQFAKADAYQKELAREYARATEEIRRSIEVFYQRYAENGEVSMAEARRQLSGDELRRFKMTLEEFTAKAKDNADGRWTKQLNEVYYRVRVSRYEALLTEIQQQVELLAGSRQKGTGKLLSDVYEDTYYRTIYEIQRGIGFGTTFAKVDDDTLEKVLGTQFAGSNWSKRIWGDRDKLVTELRTKLAQAFIRGESSERTARDLAERMGVSRSNAERLVQTETAFFVGEATVAGYKASGVVDKYEILATLDNRTSEICRSMDGKVFALSEREVGVNYPPLHARCRTTVVPYFDDEFDVGERIARGEGGKTYYVPGDMTYTEWKKQYADDAMTAKERKLALKKEIENEKIKKIREYIRSDAVSKKVHEGQQGKHIRGHNNYIEGRSYLTISMDEVQKLINRYAGTGEIRFTRKGEWDQKEIIITDDEVGVYIDQSTMQEYKPDGFKIHYGKKGVHIVPYRKER
ncbi:polymorphic toxin type 50 domain-containing protein [Paenibacillus naphthalenovorans]|uniref:polymorphic toxin type 50 domain-containing protein n=1 Tax=Paenibacillus naphthalenovorans TaxID=162209 RepID=UPI003D2C139F